MINGNADIHIMDGNKISKNFIVAVVGVLGFALIMGYFFYISLNSYDLFLATIKNQKMTLLKSDTPIRARDNSCPYQVHFEALDSSGQKIRARYCGGVYLPTGKINIKEVLKN